MLYLHKDHKALSLEGRRRSSHTGIDTMQVNRDMEMGSTNISRCPKGAADNPEEP
jgi:hypothetical protein